MKAVHSLSVCSLADARVVTLVQNQRPNMVLARDLPHQVEREVRLIVLAPPCPRHLCIGFPVGIVLCENQLSWSQCYQTEKSHVSPLQGYPISSIVS